MIVGIYDTNIDQVVKTFPAKSVRNHKDLQGSNYLAFEVDSSKYLAGYYHDNGSILYNESYTPPTEAIQFVAERAINNAMEFGSILIREFAAENVAMGITQLGKTADVLSIMEERVEFDPINKPGVMISVMGSINAASLYETLNVIDYHITKANNGDYDNLSPFITPARLTEFKQKIVDYLT